MANPSLLYDPFRGFRFWNIDDIRTSAQDVSSGKIVANVNDLVIDYANGFFRVIAVDDTAITPGIEPTYIPILQKIDLSTLGVNTVDTSLYQRFGMYQPHVMQKIYFDSTVTPHTLTIDDRYLIFGSENVNAIAFKGYDTTVAGTVISEQFDSNGQLIGNRIPLIRVDPNNDAIKRPSVINTEFNFLDGEIITLQVYNNIGGDSGKHSFIVVRSNAIRANELNTPVIVDVKLLTNLLDNQQLDLINAPANVPLTGGDFKAMLLYNSGVRTTIPVDGIKCKLHGLDNFNTSLISDVSTVVLAYYPDRDEPIINASNPTLNFVSSIYRIRTVQNVLDYSFKIYVVPVYDAVNIRYNLKFYLTSVKYNILVELNTNLIHVVKQGGGVIDYSPTADVQTIQVSVLLSDIYSLLYPGYRFVQTFNLNFGPPTINANPWIVDYKGNNTGVYGIDNKMHFSQIGYHALDLSMGLLTLEQWLRALYDPIHVIYDQNLMSSPPTPTHFKVRYSTVITDAIDVNNWNILINDPVIGLMWQNMGTVEIIWLKQTNIIGDYLTLGVSPVMIFNDLV